MATFSALRLAEVCDGALLGADVAFERLSLDSRQGCESALFVALSAERDGHAFVADAVAEGAVAVLVERQLDIDVPQVVVADTYLALHRFAAWWRQQLVNTRFVALTGSNGKTSTKNMLQQALAGQCRVQCTAGNLNNHLGVPLTLLSLAPDCEVAVVELGTSGPGEIGPLTALVRPDVSVLLNVGTAHLGGFASRGALRSEKSEIFNAAPSDAVCVVDNALLAQPEVSEHLGSRRALTFGDGGEYAFVAGQVRAPTKRVDLTLRVLGEHNLRNAEATLAVSDILGYDLNIAAEALGAFVATPGRLEVLYRANGRCVINDAYNANRESTLAAIDTLASLAGRKWLLLGDLAELGDTTVEVHRELVEYATENGIRVLYHGKHVAEFADLAVSDAEDEKAVFDALCAANTPVTLLAKGSRSAAMDKWAHAIALRLEEQEKHA